MDAGGAAYVTGETYSTDATFPNAVGPDLTANGSSDAFVVNSGHHHDHHERTDPPTTPPTTAATTTTTTSPNAPG